MNDKAPKFVEQIICLANSRKITGRCVAGKRMGDKSWCRPVSNRPGREISEFDQRYPDGETAKLLDVISVPCIKKVPDGHQSENVLIDDRFYWENRGRASWQEILALVDQNADLWANGFHAYYNKNNRVPKAYIDRDSGSLRLIYLEKIVLHAQPKAPEFGNMKPIVRASFVYKNQEYRLDLTDPEHEAICLKKGTGEYSLSSAVACVSLTETYEQKMAKFLPTNLSLPSSRRRG
ncbi:MAG: hypothetical protein LBI87_15845 [Candidatus Accumulibacter sp.]|jgi:hypothetical protein|nr:hypothetical protein [Accumulibacter sp.]